MVLSLEFYSNKSVVEHNASTDMRANQIVLVTPDTAHLPAFLEMVREYNADGDGRYGEALADPVGYLAHLRRLSRGEELPDHLVQQSTFWLLRKGRVLGQSRLRHELNDLLQIEGGHIGYDIRPSERNRGYGKAMLELTLEKARAIGLSRVMLTCDSENLASVRVIETNGGKWAGSDVSQRTGKPIHRYWIELSPFPE